MRWSNKISRFALWVGVYLWFCHSGIQVETKSVYSCFYFCSIQYTVFRDTTEVLEAKLANANTGN